MLFRSLSRSLSLSLSFSPSKHKLNPPHLSGSGPALIRSQRIKEEEGGEWDAESPTNNGASGQADSASLPNARNPKPASGSMSLALDKCSMSALARQEDEDYCILSSDDFEMCTDTEGADALDRTDDTASGSRAKATGSGSTEPCSEDDWDEEEADADVPYYTLVFLAEIGRAHV